jgi:hypothetical protein
MKSWRQATCLRYWVLSELIAHEGPIGCSANGFSQKLELRHLPRHEIPRLERTSSFWCNGHARTAPLTDQKKSAPPHYLQARLVRRVQERTCRSAHLRCVRYE